MHEIDFVTVGTRQENTGLELGSSVLETHQIVVKVRFLRILDRCQV